jgi:iron complex transport system substrate-binding protein
MRRKLIVALLVVVGLAAVAGTAVAQDSDACDFPYETPNGEVIQEEPDTVAPGIASVSQTFWEMGINDNDAKEIVGLTTNSFYLEDTDGYDSLGNTLSGGYEEKVIDKNPDIVVNALFEPTGLENSLDDAGIDYVFLPQAGGFDDIKRNVRTVGRSIGECEAAEEVVNEMENTVSRVENAVQGRDKPVVMYGTPTDDPGQFDNFVPGNGTFKHGIITTAGGDNVYDRIGVDGGGASGSLEVRISGEQAVLALNEDPDWIVITEGASVPRNDLYNSTTAVQEDQILRVNTNYISQDAPRVTVPLERMARAFHPQAFEASGGGGGGGGGYIEEPEDEASEEVFTASVDSVEGTSRATFGNGYVEAVELGAEVEGDVTVETVDVGDGSGTPLRRFSVTVPEAARNEPGTVRVTVDSGTLNETGASGDDLLVVKTGGVPPLPLNTTVLDTDDGVTVVADTPGFSEFAVVASFAPVARAEATVDEDTVVLSASDSTDAYGEIVGYAWEVNGETHEGETVEVDGGDGATVTVTNDAGLTNSTTVSIPDVEGNGTETEGERTSGTVEDGDEDGDADDEGNTTDGADEDTDGEGMPGFTALVALVAFAVAVLVRR